MYYNKIIVSLGFIIFSANANRSSTSSFFSLVEEPYFIDKTELLRFIFIDELHPSKTPVHYINCPLGFGKRSNLLMIKAFAELEVDAETNNRNPGSWMKATAMNVFRDLKIGQYTNMLIKHLAKYPVIHLDFWVSKNNTIRSIERVLNDVLLESLKKYKWLADLFAMNLERRPPPRRWLMRKKEYEAKYSNIFNVSRQDAAIFVKIFHEDLSIEELEIALCCAGKVLYNYFQETKVVLLVENFQRVALQSFAICKKLGVKFYSVLNGMLEEALENGKYFKVAVITSTGGFANTITAPYAFLDEHKFTNYFGFLESDVLTLCSRYNISSDYQKKILSYGYLTAGKDKTIYQPSTTIDLILDIHHRGEISSHLDYKWTDPDWHGFLISFAEMSELFRAKIETLLQEGNFKYYISKRCMRGTFAQFIELCEKRFQTARAEDEHEDAFFNFCLAQGYFSHAPGTMFNYTVPHHGVRETLRSLMNKWAYVYSTVMISV